MKKAVANFAVVMSFCFCTPTLAQQHSVADLAWMAGSWVGQLGSSTIEEIWSRPSANSVQASVRIGTGGMTTVHEFIVISQVDDSLVLSLQRWGPGYEPLGPVTRMTLVELTEQSVTFDADSTADIVRLTYRRKDEDTFEISVTMQDASEIVMTLTQLE